MITVKQFGFTNGAGVIGNVGDGSLLTFYQPVTTDFAAYSAQFFQADKTTLNFSASFPAIELDLLEPKRIPQILLKVETGLTLGPSVLIGSDVGATSVADTLVTGDVLLDQYTGAQMCGNRFLTVKAMQDADIRKRFLRFLQRSSLPSVAPPTPGPANSYTYDAGSGVWPVVPYSSKLVIESWGGGASGGTNGGDGGDTSAGIDAYWVQTSLGGKGNNFPGSAGGLGGTSSGANTLNLTGGNGEAPFPLTGAPGYSGAGGTSPNGGVGGPRIYQVFNPSNPMYYYGNDGQAPGGGGSGHSMWYPAGDVVFDKRPGGGAGGYSRHEVLLGAAYAQPGEFIGWSVGNGGVSTNGDGRGAQGRVRFSWA